MKNLISKFVTGTLLALLFNLHSVQSNAQAVTEIITTYKNYWKSGATAINAIKPDTSHTLLAFTFNNIRYSTGVNNAALTAHGDTFIPADFRALSIAGMTGTVNNNTKIGLGALYDGVYNGPCAISPTNNLAMYMTDGIKGLNLGTGVANLPAGIINFGVSNLQLGAVGDGVPDILVTQIADPTGSADQYEFTDTYGNRIGNLVSVSFNSINAVANWTADFYEANTNPMVLIPGFTQTDRPLRLWAADYSAFGITPANYSSIAHFVIHLNGNSDIAFVSYNYAAAVILPVNFSFFHTDVTGKDIRLSWQTVTEINSHDFIIETSTDGQHFTTLDTLSAAGNSNSAINYSYRHINPGTGNHFYRLRETDLDGKFMYSAIRKETILANISLGVYPNPAMSDVILTHSPAKQTDRIDMYTISGQHLLQKTPSTGNTQTTIGLSAFPKGYYMITWRRPGTEMITQKIMRQ
jgi:Secretion system C-terminal sorting domain